MPAAKPSYLVRATAQSFRPLPIRNDESMTLWVSGNTARNGQPIRLRPGSLRVPGDRDPGHLYFIWYANPEDESIILLDWRDTLEEAVGARWHIINSAALSRIQYEGHQINLRFIGSTLTQFAGQAEIIIGKPHSTVAEN